MQRRFDRLAADCDHDSIFALSYLRTTEEYRRTIEGGTFFEDTAFVNHEDAVFARYYFEATDAWESGRRAAVPPAWAIAFKAADERSMPASGNLSLGINAHVQRDLPFVLAGIGLVKPDGSSRKEDHDRVNVFLNRVTDGLIAEIAARFDPTADDRDLPTSIDDMGIFQLIPTWREIAWRNAERLASAPNAAGPGAGGPGHRGLRGLPSRRAATQLGLPARVAEQRGPGRVLRDRITSFARWARLGSNQRPLGEQPPARGKAFPQRATADRVLPRWASLDLRWREGG